MAYRISNITCGDQHEMKHVETLVQKLRISRQRQQSIKSKWGAFEMQSLCHCTGSRPGSWSSAGLVRGRVHGGWTTWSLRSLRIYQMMNLDPVLDHVAISLVRSRWWKEDIMRKGGKGEGRSTGAQFALQLCEGLSRGRMLQQATGKPTEFVWSSWLFFRWCPFSPVPPVGPSLHRRAPSSQHWSIPCFPHPSPWVCASPFSCSLL